LARLAKLSVHRRGESEGNRIAGGIDFESG
jgi:hypothetical protein